MTDLPGAAHATDTRLQTILKAVVLGARVPDPASTTGGEGIGALFGISGALEPPYDPEALRRGDDGDDQSTRGRAA